MKINIQNMDNDILELDEVVDPTFLSKAYRSFYPDPIKVHVSVDKFSSDYKFDINLHTSARYQCDRCLHEYRQEFQAAQSQIVQIGDGALSGQEDVMQLSPGTTEIELGPFLEEIIILYHPAKMLCSDDCKGLCPNCGGDLNKDNCNCGFGKIDPRWDELKKFIK